MTDDYLTITLDRAMQAVQAYNSGVYHGRKNIEIDRQAREKFDGGLSCSLEGIREQVRFIGVDYGGTAGFPAARVLVPEIASDIYEVRDQYSELARNAPPLLETVSSVEVIKKLYSPFVKLIHGRQNWQVWAAKFWHFLKPDAFPVEDSRVDKFFHMHSRPNSPEKYVAVMQRVREFILSDQAWLPQLRAIDAGRARSDIKLWDKVFYGVGEPASCPKK
jgi:hypothetical protein